MPHEMSRAGSRYPDSGLHRKENTYRKTTRLTYWSGILYIISARTAGRVFGFGHENGWWKVGLPNRMHALSMIVGIFLRSDEQRVNVPANLVPLWHEEAPVLATRGASHA